MMTFFKTTQDQQNLQRLDQRILIVDDDIDNIEILRLFLEHLGFQKIDACLNGKQAFQFVSQHEVDIIFLDLRMPEWDGYKTLTEIHSPNNLISNKQPNNIVFSANSFQKNIEKSNQKWHCTGFKRKFCESNLSIDTR